MPPSALRSVPRRGCGLCPSGCALAYFASLVSVFLYHHNGWVVMLSKCTFKGARPRLRTSGATRSSTPRQFREDHRCQPVFAAITVHISNFVAKKRTLARVRRADLRLHDRGSYRRHRRLLPPCCPAPRRETQCDRGDFLRRGADRARRGCIPMELWMRARRLCGFLAFQCPLQNSTVHRLVPVTLCFLIGRQSGVPPPSFLVSRQSACTVSLQAAQHRSDPTKVQSPRPCPTKVGARKQGLMVVRSVKRSTSCRGKVRGPVDGSSHLSPHVRVQPELPVGSREHVGQAARRTRPLAPDASAIGAIGVARRRFHQPRSKLRLICSLAHGGAPSCV